MKQTRRDYIYQHLHKKGINTTNVNNWLYHQFSKMGSMLINPTFLQQCLLNTQPPQNIHVELKEQPNETFLIMSIYPNYKLNPMDWVPMAITTTATVEIAQHFPFIFS